MDKMQEIIKRLMEAGIITRSLTVNPSTLEEKTRSIEGVFATENVVRVYDWNRGEVINEVLLMSGMKFPEQIPFLDSHNRYSYQDQIGSARDMKIVGSQLIGRVVYSNNQSGEGAWVLSKERHITDLSIGYVVSQARWVEAGESYTHTDGRVFNGPIQIATETQVREVSLTPIGADSFTKLRSDTPAPLTARIKELEQELSEVKQINRQLVIKINSTLN